LNTLLIHYLPKRLHQGFQAIVHLLLRLAVITTLLDTQGGEFPLFLGFDDSHGERRVPAQPAGYLGLF